MSNDSIKDAVLYRVVDGLDGLDGFSGYVPNRYGFRPRSLGYEESKKKFENKYTVIGFEEFINDVFINSVVEKIDSDNQYFTLNMKNIFENLIKDVMLEQNIGEEEKKIFERLYERLKKDRSVFENDVILGNFDENLKMSDNAIYIKELDQECLASYHKIVNRNIVGRQKEDIVNQCGREIINADAKLRILQKIKSLIKISSHKAAYYFLAVYCPDEIDIFLRAFLTKGKNLTEQDMNVLKKKILKFGNETGLIKQVANCDITDEQIIIEQILKSKDHIICIKNILKLFIEIDKSHGLEMIFQGDNRIEDLLELVNIIMEVHNPSEKISNIEREVICRRFEQKLKSIVKIEVENGHKRKIKHDIFDFMHSQNFGQMKISQFKEKYKNLVGLYDELVIDVINDEDRIRNLYWLEKHYHLIFYSRLASVLVKENLARKMNKAKFLIKIMDIALFDAYLDRTKNIEKIVKEILGEFYRKSGEWDSIKHYWKVKSEITSLKIFKYKLLRSLEGLNVDKKDIEEAWVEISLIYNQRQLVDILKIEAESNNKTFYSYMKLFLENNNRIAKMESDIIGRFIIR